MMEAFIGQDMDYIAGWLVHQGLQKLVDVFKGVHCLYFFIAKKQQLVLYFYITCQEIENNQRGEYHCYAFSENET